MGNWLLSILGGVIGAPVGAVLGIAVAYGIYYLAGETEREGRHGLLAGVTGTLCGAPLGFYAGFRLTSALLQ